jgi:hypothetical protein
MVRGHGGCSILEYCRIKWSLENNMEMVSAYNQKNLEYGKCMAEITGMNLVINHNEY